MSELHKHFIKYLLVGGSGFFLDIGTLIFFKESIGFQPTLAVVFNQIIAIAYSYTLQRRWTFRSGNMVHGEAARYLTVFFLNYLIAIAVMYVGNEQLGFDYRFIRVANIAVSVLWNFYLYRYWVFADKQKKTEVGL